jgi:membrane protein
MLASAGATLYGALAMIPTVLLAIGVGGLIFGQARMAEYGRTLADAVPGDLGAGRWIGAVFGAGLSLSPLALVLALFMSSAYGRGLLWLWVLHLVVCIGYTFTWSVDEVWGSTAANSRR